MKRATSFKKVVLCHTNDFRSDLNDKIKVWVEANGGKYSKELTNEVTHLVASKKAWKRYLPIVKEARKMRTVRIVNYDWLEDSLMRRPVRALPEDKYLFEQIKLRTIKRHKTQSQKSKIDQSSGSTQKITIPFSKRVETTGIEFDKARQEFEQDMGTAGFHPYSDNTGFVYIITLLRHDILRNRFDKYKIKVGHDPLSSSQEVLPGRMAELYHFSAPEPFSTAPAIGFKLCSDLLAKSRIHIANPWAQCIQLYESDTQPHTYACYVQYTRVGVQKSVRVLAPPGSTWDFAWTMFEKIFMAKVGVMWDQRSRNGTEMDIDMDNDSDNYQYQAPKIGEPEGVRKVVGNRFSVRDDQTPIDLTQDERLDEVEDGGIRPEEGQQDDLSEPEGDASDFDDSHLP